MRYYPSAPTYTQPPPMPRTRQQQQHAQQAWPRSMERSIAANTTILRQLVQTLQGVQAEQKDQATLNQQTAVALTEVVDRLKTVEKWQADADTRRHDEEQRRNASEDKRPDRRIALAAIIVACVSAFGYILNFLAPHWR